jgi:4-oxalomesaconate hydratase
MIDENTNLLVISAHAADFVWRSGGTIAKYVNQGANVDLVILSYGARGESNDLWRIEGQTLEKVKQQRHGELMEAAGRLGIQHIELWDFQDYHMEMTPERTERLVRKIREVRPHCILTHGPRDAFNPDHETVSKYVFDASVLSTSSGVLLEGTRTARQAQIFGFEPHQTEISDFKPEVFIDITETYSQKVDAMKCFKAQHHLIDYYGSKAPLRGNQAARCSGNKAITHAEAFSRFFPYVGGEFV